MFGLDADIFDAFGMIWGELKEEGYANLIMIDDEADRQSSAATRRSNRSN